MSDERNDRDDVPEGYEELSDDERREKGLETEEEARERVAQVRATQIFGDTPTDPTIGDVVVPAHDEEGANLGAAAVASEAEDDEDGDAADLSPEEAKRQHEALDADEVDEAADDSDDDSSDEGSAEDRKDDTRKDDNVV